MNSDRPAAAAVTTSTEVLVRPWTVTHRVDAPLWKQAVSWIGHPFEANWPLIAPAVGLLIFTTFFRWTNADLFVSSLFYNAASHHWPWFFFPGCTLFYRVGTYPAFALFGIGLLLVAVGRTARRWQLYRAGFFLVLLFIIGPGLIVNQGFKNHWGRPRPHQVERFGGLHAFVPVGSPGPLQQHNSSFPSGHAAVAFYLIGPAFLASPRRRGLATGLMIGGLAFGGTMALVRVIQGGHFVSDVVWSAAIVYFTAVALAAVILRPNVGKSRWTWGSA